MNSSHNGPVANFNNGQGSNKVFETSKTLWRQQQEWLTDNPEFRGNPRNLMLLRKNMLKWGHHDAVVGEFICRYEDVFGTMERTDDEGINPWHRKRCVDIFVCDEGRTSVGRQILGNGTRYIQIKYRTPTIYRTISIKKWHLNKFKSENILLVVGVEKYTHPDYCQGCDIKKSWQEGYEFDMYMYEPNNGADVYESGDIVYIRLDERYNIENIIQRCRKYWE